jgi:hypothetical protein
MPKSSFRASPADPRAVKHGRMRLGPVSSSAQPDALRPGSCCNVYRPQELLPGRAVLRVEGEPLDNDGVEATEGVRVGLGRQFALADGLVKAVLEFERQVGTARFDAGDDRL